jgi:hypothetical protein
MVPSLLVKKSSIRNNGEDIWADKFALTILCHSLTTWSSQTRDKASSLATRTAISMTSGQIACRIDSLRSLCPRSTILTAATRGKRGQILVAQRESRIFRVCHLLSVMRETTSRLGLKTPTIFESKIKLQPWSQSAERVSCHGPGEGT